MKAQYATSAWLKPDSRAPEAMALTFATEPFDACAVSTSSGGFEIAFASRPPIG